MNLFIFIPKNNPGIKNKNVIISITLEIIGLIVSPLSFTYGAKGPNANITTKAKPKSNPSPAHFNALFSSSVISKSPKCISSGTT